VRGHLVVVTLVFLASFFPVGVALFNADHWLQWVGRLDVGFLVAALLMWIGQRAGKVAPSAAREQP
jgi:protein-S-isoprenylcysteine O-methyltransferase Ste14